MGDAAHSMTNHMAQGAATSTEDGAFLAIFIQAVENKICLRDVVGSYEKVRIPKTKTRQEISFLNGWIWQMEDGEG